MSRQTVANCFRKSGFKKGEIVPTEYNVDVSLNAVKDAYDRILHNENTSSFDKFVNFDYEVAVAGTLTDADIVASVTQRVDGDNVDDEEDEDKESVICYHE